MKAVNPDDALPRVNRSRVRSGREGLGGIVTERDVLRAVAAGSNLATEPVTSWMTPGPDTVPADMTVDEAAVWMVAAGYRHLPVVDGSEILGIVSVRDLLWALAGDEGR